MLFDLVCLHLAELGFGESMILKPVSKRSGGTYGPQRIFLEQIEIQGLVCSLHMIIVPYVDKGEVVIWYGPDRERYAALSIMDGDWIVRFDEIVLAWADLDYCTVKIIENPN